MADVVLQKMARKLILAALAAWVIAIPSIAEAQQRGEQQGRGRPQQQQDMRRGGGFSGMLRDIAGARLDRAHAAQRAGRPKPNGRGGGGGGRRR